MVEGAAAASSIGKKSISSVIVRSVMAILYTCVNMISRDLSACKSAGNKSVMVGGE